MAVFTCDCNGEPEHRHHPSIHMHEAAITSPFLYFPAVSPTGDVSKATMDAVVPHLRLSPRTTPSCFSTSCGTKSFYTAIEVTDMKMQQPSLSSPLSELGSASPDSPFSITSVQDDS